MQALIMMVVLAAGLPFAAWTGTVGHGRHRARRWSWL
jgi:hypothetical protein